MCGTHGSCAAAIGAGIFVSLIMGATPLSKEEWRLSNLATAECLRSIAEHGGPRCCKRNTFLAIIGAARFLASNFGISLPVGERVICEFNGMNAECIGKACPFFRGSRG